jgi:hypothetical protein
MFASVPTRKNYRAYSFTSCNLVDHSSGCRSFARLLEKPAERFPNLRTRQAHRE